MGIWITASTGRTRTDSMGAGALFYFVARTAGHPMMDSVELDWIGSGIAKVYFFSVRGYGRGEKGGV